MSCKKDTSHQTRNNNIESKMQEFGAVALFQEMIIDYKVPMRSGKIQHKIIKPKKENVDLRIKTFKHLYNMTSGRPRLYLDNSIEFLLSLKK